MSNEEKQKALKDALDKLNKDYGKGSVVTLGEKDTGDYEVISTGSIAFDRALGIGGFCKGRLYELMGWEGTGKSTICGHLAAECQAQGGTVAYIDAEHAVDLEYFEALGVDPTQMVFSQPNDGETGFDTARRLICSDAVDLIIIDSDSAMLPKSVIDGDIGDSAIGKKARLNSDAYPKLKIDLSNHNVCVVIISQYREKIGVMFGNPTTTQGGHALRFYADVRIEVSKSPAKNGEDQYGNVTKIKVVKNKMGAPYKKAEFEIVFGHGIDKEKEILDLAVEEGLIQKSGSWYSYGEEKIGQGMERVKEFLLSNPDIICELKDKLDGKEREVEEEEK